MRSVLKQSPLFENMSDNEIESALYRLRANLNTYLKGDIIIRADERKANLGIVISGKVAEEFCAVNGQSFVTNVYETGGLIADNRALLSEKPSGFLYRAEENCEVLLVDIGRIIKNQINGSDWQARLTRNLLIITAKKNLELSERQAHISPKSARGRILAFLTTVSLKTGSRDFLIPLDRSQMAQYLNLDRTALSKELGKMKAEGLIVYRKNHFIILEQPLSR